MRHPKGFSRDQGRRSRRSSPPRLSVDTFRDDPLYPRIARAVGRILARDRVVAPVDVLVSMDLLAPERLEDWRRGRVAFLEKVVDGNLTRLSRLLRILRFHAHDLNLVPRLTEYHRRGKGPSQRLRFTKTGDPGVEKAYRRHFEWPGKKPFPMERLTEDGRPREDGS